MQSWKIIAASVAGSSHAARGELCADAFGWEVLNDEVLIVVASDGAGSAKSGRAGAAIVCAVAVKAISDWLKISGDAGSLNKDFGLQMLGALQNELTARAEEAEQNLSDFACTLLAAVVNGSGGAFYQIGDGAIVYAAATESENFCLAVAPQQGEYANATNFVTDNRVADVLDFRFIEQPIADVAIFTDGLQRVALDYKTNTAHAPFFRSMLTPLRAVEPMDKDFHGKLENLQKQLSDFLDSSKINERTDDDKTLILASRRSK